MQSFQKHPHAPFVAVKSDWAYEFFQNILHHLVATLNKILVPKSGCIEWSFSSEFEPKHVKHCNIMKQLHIVSKIGHWPQTLNLLLHVHGSFGHRSKLPAKKL